MTRRATGYLAPDTPLGGTYTELSADDAAQLDVDIDLSHLCGSVRDQGDVNSCLAHAFVSAEELWARRCGLTPEPLSAVALYQATLADAGRAVDGGATLSETVAAAASGGLVPEAEWEDDPARWSVPLPPELRERAARSRRVLHTLPLPPDEVNIRWALSCGHGVVVGLRLFEASTDGAADSGLLALPEPGDRPFAGHAVLLTGWNRARRTFISQWAWGRDFGHGGFVELPAAYVCDPVLTPEIFALRSFRRLPIV